MTDDPIDLDGHRNATDQREAEERRRPMNDAAQPCIGSLDEQMNAEPARTWVEVMQKCRFLLERYSTTPEADEDRIRKLIRRAIGDMERLRKRQERK